jgi:hypothetical protein
MACAAKTPRHRFDQIGSQHVRGFECNRLLTSVDVRDFVNLTSLYFHLLELFSSICGYEAYECVTVCQPTPI